MAVLQTTYSEDLAIATVGQIVSASPFTVDSYVANAAIGYGLGVKRITTPAGACEVGGDYDDWEEVTQAAEAIDSSETAIDVDDATVFDIGDRVRFDDEQMIITGLTLGATDSITVTRAVNGTTAATHADNTAAYRAPGGPPIVSSFLGVAVLDHLIVGGVSGQENQYRKGDIVAVCNRGLVAVTAEAAVSAGGIVTMNTTTGRFSSRRPARSSGGSQAQANVPDAVWETSAAAGGLAILRLFGIVG